MRREFLQGAALVHATELLHRVSRIRPQLGNGDLLRLSHLLNVWASRPERELLLSELDDDELEALVSETSQRLSAIMDQHSAVTEELDALAATSPTEYTPQHLWTLAKALRIQSQVVDLYVGVGEAKAAESQC